MNYTRVQATALRLIAGAGRTITVVKYSTAEEAGKPWRTPAGARQAHEDSVDVVAVSVPVSSATRMGFFAQQEDLVKTVQQTWLIGGDVDLDGFNGVEVDGVPYKIRLLDRLKPADVTLMYVLGVSR